MKKALFLLLAAALCFGLSLPVCARQTDVADYMAEWQLDIDLAQKLPKQTQKALEELNMQDPTVDLLGNLTPAKAADFLLSQAKQQLAEPGKTFAHTMGAVVLMAFMQGVGLTAGEKSSAARVFDTVGVLVVTTTVARPVISCVQSTAASIAAFSDFILSFLPVFCGLLVANGQAAAAATTQTFLFWVCQIATQFAAQALVPLVGFFMAICLVGAAAPGLDLTGIAGAAKAVVSWALGLMMTLFVGLLSLSSVVAAGSDNLGVRTARFLLGSFVPVVGGALSEAYTTAQGCLRLIKTSVGVYAAVAAVVLFLPLVLRLAAWYAAMALSAAAAQTLGIGRLASLLKAFGTAMGILLAIAFCFALLLVVSITLILLVGQGVG